MSARRVWPRPVPTCTEYVDTYYVPSGDEHVQQTPNEAAEEVVVRRTMAGEHVHSWSLDSGVMCHRGRFDA